MKNKKLLLFLLTAISVSAIGAVGCKNKPSDDTDHEHAYTWQSNDDGHWQKCDCGETTTVESHVDVKNNATSEDGKDGKCDVCDYAIKQAVTFNVQGHGTAPEAQNVGYGEKATKPADPVDEDYNFLGWYKDAACTTAFDFNAGITDATVIYAKWEVNTTPGESKQYAYTLELNTPNLHALTAKGYTYYKYTATEAGRYQIDLGLGNSQNCYFTTDKDGADVYYGKGYDTATKYFDLKKDESIIIKLFGTKDLAAGAEVSATVNVTVNEPLPADGWFEGTYTNGGTSIELNRKDNKVILYGEAYSFDYVGGSVDTLTFKQDLGWGDEYISTYTITRKNNKIYTVNVKGTSSSTQNYICFQKLDEPLIVGTFSGEYTPVDGNEAELISKILINADGTGSYVQNDNTVQQAYASYDANYGMLTYGQYIISPNFVDGVAVSINVFSSTFNDIVVYERTGDVLPNVLPMLENDEYIGANYSITNDYGTQYFVGQIQSMFEITAYDKDSKTYTIDVDGTTYKLVFEGEGNNALIKLYDAEDNLLDTLAYYFVNYVDLPTSGGVTAPLADFKKDFYHYEVKTVGWYQFTNSDTDIEIYYGLSKEYPVNEYYGTLVGTNKVYLAEGTVVGLKNLNPDKTGNATFTVSKVEADQGFAETDPLEINGAGMVSVPQLTKENKLYVKFTPAEAGNYLVTVSCERYGWNSYLIYYTVGGNAAGFSNSDDDYGWHGGLDGNVVSYQLTASDTTPVMIVVGEEYAEEGYSNVKVTVTKDYKVGATDLGEFVLGTPVAGEVPASVTVSAAGTYKVADTFDSNLVLTSNSAFTAKLNGLDIEVTNEDGTYTATIFAGTNLYVEVSAPVTFTVTYLEGSEQAPIAVSLTGISFTQDVISGYTYFKFNQAGDFAVSLSNAMGSHDYMLNGKAISGASFTVAVGDVLMVQQWFSDNTVTITKALPKDLLDEYSMGGVYVYVGATHIVIDEKGYELTAVSGNTYTYTAEDSSTATLVVSGETLTLNGTVLTEYVIESVLTKDQAGTYKTSVGLPITVVLNADGTGTYSFMSNNFKITLTKGDDGVYTFKYNSNGSERNCTLTFNGDGTIEVADSGMGTITLVKEAPITPPATDEVVFSGIIENTEYGTSWEVTLKFNSDFTKVTMIYKAEGDSDEFAERYVDLAVTKVVDGLYTFIDSDGDNAGCVIEGDTMEFEIEFYGSGTLTKEA